MQTELDSDEGKISETKPIIVIFGMGVGGVGVCKSSTFSSSNPVLGHPKDCFHGIPKNSFRPLSAQSRQVTAQMHCQIGHILKATHIQKAPSPELW